MYYQIIPFEQRYSAQISQLFHQAIQSISHPRYGQIKLDAWSAHPRSATYWRRQCQRGKTWLVINNSQVCGFINVSTGFKDAGYINHLYIDPQHQRQGLARLLLDQVMTWAEARFNITALSVDASYLSRPVFTAAGFITQFSSFQRKRGATLNGFYMTRELHPKATD